MKKQNVLSRLADKFNISKKESGARVVSTFRQIGQAISSPKNYETYSRKGYQANAMVYTCVDKIATAVGGVEWLLYSKKKNEKGERIEIDSHALLDLIQNPNPMQGQSAFFESWMGYYLLSGNTYCEGNFPFENKPPTELWIDRSDRMKIIGGTKGYPAAYEFTSNGSRRIFPVDFVKMKSAILHVKTFNPTDDWYGQSPLEAGIMALDQNNSGNMWNLSMLQNSASPSGIFSVGITAANPKGELSDEKFKRLKNEIDETYQGAMNAGRPMIAEGGLSWTQMSLSPKDMDFLNSRNVSAEDICRIYKVPGELVGLGQKTFSNYKEANLAFYVQTVIPYLKGIRYALNKWLAPAFGDDLYLDFNEDDIEAIVQARLDKYSTLQGVDYLTINEKRRAVKYEEKEGWDVFKIGNQIGATPDEFSMGGSFDENSLTLPKEENANTPGQEKTPPRNRNKNPEDDFTEGDEDEGKELSFGEFKVFNLLTSHELQKSRRQQNARKRRLESAFQKELREDFNDMYDEFYKVTEHVKDTSRLEYALIKTSKEFMPKFRKTIEKHDRQIMEEFGFVVMTEGKSLFNVVEKKANLNYDSYVRSFVKARSGEAITSIESTNQKQIHRVVKRLTETALENGETNPAFAKELMEEFDSLSPGRARVIARTETQIASNNASLEAVKSLELPNMEKGWVSQLAGDRRDGGKNGDGPNHQIMNGQYIPLDEKFSVPPDADMEGPGDASCTADQLCNCTCAMVYRSRN